MKERGLGLVYQPTRKCRPCNGTGCKRCRDGRRQISTWHIQYSHRGRQYRESSGSKRRADAVRLLKKRHAEIAGPKAFVGPAADRTTFEDLVGILRDDYRVNRRKSARRIETSIDRLGEFFAGYRAVDITTDVLSRYIAQRFDDGRAPSTVRNETNALRRAFRLAERAGKASSVPHFPQIDPGPPRAGFFEADEFQRVLEHLPPPVRPVAEFGYLTGWRLGEILGLRWSQVDLRSATIRLDVGSTKNRDGRVLPFSAIPELAALIERQLAYTQRVERVKQRVVPHVFHRNGKEISCIYRGWDLACQKAGCPGRLFHDLRRTAVRNLERAGVPRSIAMKVTGHKTEAIYRRYAIVNEADMAEGLGRLARYLGSGADDGPGAGSLRS